MKTFIGIIGLTFLLSACATKPLTQEVKIPVYISCVETAPEAPNYETSLLTIEASDGEKIVALSRDWSTSRIYEHALEAVIQGCQ